MKNKKRKWLCALITVLLCGMLAGCGDKTAENDVSSTEVSEAESESSAGKTESSETEAEAEVQEEATENVASGATTQDILEWVKAENIEPMTPFVWNESGNNTIFSQDEIGDTEEILYTLQENDRIFWYVGDGQEYDSYGVGPSEIVEYVKETQKMSQYQLAEVSLNVEQIEDVYFDATLNEKTIYDETIRFINKDGFIEISEIDCNNTLTPEEWFAKLDNNVYTPFMVIINDITNEKRICAIGNKNYKDIVPEKVKFNRDTDNIWIYGLYKYGDMDPATGAFKGKKGEFIFYEDFERKESLEEIRGLVSCHAMLPMEELALQEGSKEKPIVDAEVENLWGETYYLSVILDVE